MGRELYDLMNDPGETTHLCSSPLVRDIQAHLRRRLILWEVRTGA